MQRTPAKGLRGKYSHPVIGQRFGMLTVVDDSVERNKRGFAFWMFRCDCGVERRRMTTLVVRGGINSCGCLKGPAQLKAVTKYADPQEKWRNSLLGDYKKHAAERGFEFSLSREEFTALLHLPCVYCGRANVNSRSRSTGKHALKHNGVDRIDSSIGYRPGNVVPCCKTCNIMKQQLLPEEFISHIRLILRYQETLHG